MARAEIVVAASAHSRGAARGRPEKPGAGGPRPEIAMCKNCVGVAPLHKYTYPYGKKWEWRCKVCLNMKHRIWAHEKRQCSAVRARRRLEPFQP